MEYQANNENLNNTLKSLPAIKKDIIENLIIDGKTCQEAAKLCKVRKETVVAIRQNMEQEGKLELGSWKKEVSTLLANFVQKGALRLNEEIDNMPIGQIPMSIAIAIDKVRDLQDVPTVTVSTRLTITQDELNKHFSLDEKKENDITIDIEQKQKNE